MEKRKPYIAKDDKDPGLILPPDPDHVPEPKHISSRQLLIRICEKLGVSIE